MATSNADRQPMIDRLSDKQVQECAVRDHDPIGQSLAQEVRASRELIAGLLGLHSPVFPTNAGDQRYNSCSECGTSLPCQTVRLIEAAQS